MATTNLSDHVKVTQARALLAGQRAGLEAAIATFEGDRLSSCDLRTARKMLGMVKRWQREGDDFVTLALGFMGSNGWQPLINGLCRTADGLRSQERLAA